MELIDYLRMLARRWRWVVGCALVGWILGALYASMSPRVYEASVLLFVGSSGITGTDGQARDDLSASRFTLERMDSYAALVDSPDVTRAVNDELQLGLQPDDIAGVLSASVLDDTVVLNVTARGDAPAETANIANAAAARLGAVIELVEAPGTGAASPVNVTVTRPASAPSAPTSPNTTLALALGLVAGLGVGLLVAALRDQALTNRTADRGPTANAEDVGDQGSAVRRHGPQSAPDGQSARRASERHSAVDVTPMSARRRRDAAQVPADQDAVSTDEGAVAAQGQP